MRATASVYDPALTAAVTFASTGYDPMDPVRVDDIRVIDAYSLQIVVDATNPETWINFFYCPFSITPLA